MNEQGRLEDLEVARDHLVAALELLASPAARQAEWLDSHGLGDCADELVLEFDDWLQRGNQMTEAGLLDPGVFERLEAIDAGLGAMPARFECWCASGLNGPEWSDIRRLAGEVLPALR